MIGPSIKTMAASHLSDATSRSSFSGTCAAKSHFSTAIDFLFKCRHFLIGVLTDVARRYLGCETLRYHDRRAAARLPGEPADRAGVLRICHEVGAPERICAINRADPSFIEENLGTDQMRGDNVGDALDAAVRRGHAFSVRRRTSWSDAIRARRSPRSSQP